MGADQEGDHASSIWASPCGSESVDFFFPAENGTTVRSSRSFSRGAIVLEHTQKNKVRACTFSWTTFRLADGRGSPSAPSPRWGRTSCPRSWRRRSGYASSNALPTSGRTGPLIDQGLDGQRLPARRGLRDDKETDHASYEVEIELGDAASYFEKQFHTTSTCRAR